jgi:hypothetical protein
VSDKRSKTQLRARIKLLWGVVRARNRGLSEKDRHIESLALVMQAEREGRARAALAARNELAAAQKRIKALKESEERAHTNWLAVEKDRDELSQRVQAQDRELLTLRSFFCGVAGILHHGEGAASPGDLLRRVFEAATRRP